MIDVFVECIPAKTTAQQGSRLCTVSGRARIFKSSKHLQAQKSVSLLFRQHVPETPLTGPLYVSLTFVYPYRASERKRVVAAGDHVFIDVKPDVDNIAKGVIDVLTKLRFWNDDGQIADLRCRKLWGPTPGIKLLVKAAELPKPPGQPPQLPLSSKL